MLQVLVCRDCAVNVEATAEGLAHIAVSWVQIMVFVGILML